MKKYMQKVYAKLPYNQKTEYYTCYEGLYYPFSIIMFFLGHNTSDDMINYYLNSDNLSGGSPTIRVLQIDENTIQMYDIFEALDYEENEDADEPDVVTLTPTNFIYLLKTWKEILHEKPPICYLTYDEETNWINLTANPDDINGFEDSNARDIH